MIAQVVKECNTQKKKITKSTENFSFCYMAGYKGKIAIPIVKRSL